MSERLEVHLYHVTMLAGKVEGLKIGRDPVGCDEFY